MSSLNKVTLIGNVGKDPEVRSFGDKEVANLSIATSEKWFDKTTNERKEKTEWHKVSVFNEALVKLIKSYVKKGAKLYIEGRLQTRKWTDSNNQEKYTTEIVLNGYSANILILDWLERSSTKSGSTNNENQVSDNFEIDDEIPF